MIVAFMDLLGFSSILQENFETALDILNAVNYKIRINDSDKKVMESRGIDVDPFKNWFTFSFDNLISISDSLVIGSNDPNTFVVQLCNFVASLFIEYSSPFKHEFECISDVKSDIFMSYEDKVIRNHNAFPILFRGGVSFGDSVNFFREIKISWGKLDYGAQSVTGINYLEAVKLESAGKGPRLFCNKKVVDQLSNKKMIKIVNKEDEIYEIVWTILGCESHSNSVDNKWNNVSDSITFKMLPPAVSLYKFFCNKEKGISDHYLELLKLVCAGIVKYAKDYCENGDDRAIRCINFNLEKSGVSYKIDNTILSNFLE